MQQFFFHIISDALNAPDLVGVELKDAVAARDHAEALLSEIWAQRVLTGKPPLTGWLEVVDGEERAVLSLPL